jgi:hypothetical protein
MAVDKIQGMTLDDKKALLGLKEQYASTQSSGGDVSSINAQANALRGKYGLAASATGYVTADQLRGMIDSDTAKMNQPVIPQAPAYDPQQAAQDAIAAYMASQKAAYGAAYQSNVAGIDMAAGGSIADQQALIPQADKQFGQQVEAINVQQYSDLERQKVTAQQRGIASSQQQQGIEAGIARSTGKNIATAAQNRTERIQSINDRITQIKREAELQKVQAAAARDMGVAQAEGAGAMKLLDRQFSLEDRAAQEKFAIEETQKSREHDVMMAELSYDQRVNLAKLDQTFSREMAELGFDQKIALAQFDQAFQFKMMEADQTFRKEFFQLEAGLQRQIAGMQISAQERLFNMDAALRKDLFNLDHANKLEIMNLDTGTQMKFFDLDTKRQKDILGIQQTHREAFFGLESAQQEKILSLSQKGDMNMFEANVMISELANYGFFNTYQSSEELYDSFKNSKSYAEASNILGRNITYLETIGLKLGLPSVRETMRKTIENNTPNNRNKLLGDLSTIFKNWESLK